MVMHAYSEDYVEYAQRIMGDMFDYAFYSYELDLDEFFSMFLVSDVSYQFESGNPSYVAGKTGCELAKEVLRESGRSFPSLPEEMYVDKSPEYWAGWGYAYYQWYTARTFARIHKAVSIQNVLDMYPVFHEMDIMQFVESMNEKWNAYYIDTNLKRIRLHAGLSQKELSELSGVSIRQIQLFEQRQRNINHTKAIDVLRLSRVLGCKSEDLLEI